MVSRDGGAGSGRRKPPLGAGLREIDPRDYELLRKFTSEQGKILSARLTGLPPKLQRTMARAVRRARVMGILK